MRFCLCLVDATVAVPIIFSPIASSRAFSAFSVCVVLFFVGMGVFVVSRPVVGLWGGLVFWFGLFFGLCWDGWGGFLFPCAMLGYVGWDGIGMGRYVAVFCFMVVFSYSCALMPIEFIS
jgi:hypothetical protein